MLTRIAWTLRATTLTSLMHRRVFSIGDDLLMKMKMRELATQHRRRLPHGISCGRLPTPSFKSEARLSHHRKRIRGKPVSCRESAFRSRSSKHTSTPRMYSFPPAMGRDTSITS